MKSHRAFLALGSNLGDREGQIFGALRELTSAGDIQFIKLSSLIETDAVGPEPQPRYLNAAAELATMLSPRELLERLLAVEQLGGRVRAKASCNGPRTIDLDLLLYDDVVLDEPGLTIPHPRMHQRHFVLRPLSEIAGSVIHPVLRRTVLELLSSLDDSPEDT